MTGSRATPARRIGAAVLAAAWGLVVGVTAASALGTVQVLLSPGLEIAPTARARIVGPMMILAEGVFWGLLGGGMFVFPVAVLALAFFQPRNTRTAALAMSALILFPIVLVVGRMTHALLLAIPVWLGVRVGLRTFWRMMPTPMD